MSTPEPDTVDAGPTGTTPTVSWFELFYDLVLVAAVSVCNDAFLANPTREGALTATLGIAAISWVWFATTLANNVFPGQDLLRRFLVLLQMGAVTIAALAVDQADGISNATGLAAFGLSLGIVAAVILWSGRGQGPRDLLRTVLPLVLAMAIGLLGALLQMENAEPYLAAAMAVSIVPVLTTQYARWQGRSMLRLDHLRERLGLFVIIVLGEGFAQLVQGLHHLGTIPRSGVFALTFLLSFALWWIYFDGTFSRHTNLVRVRWRLSLLAHFTLVLGMIGTLDVLVLLTVGRDDQLGDALLASFVASLALVLFSFAVLGFTARGRLGPAGWAQAGSGLLILVGGAAILPGEDSSPTVVIGACAAVVIANALLAAWADQASSSQRWSGSLASALRGSDPGAQER